MTNRKEAIRIAAECFPRYAGKVERAYEESGEFRSICSDLLACSRAMTYWSKVETDAGVSRSDEYEMLLESLKQEMMSWMEDHGYLGEDEMPE